MKNKKSCKEQIKLIKSTINKSHNILSFLLLLDKANPFYNRNMNYCMSEGLLLLLMHVLIEQSNVFVIHLLHLDRGLDFFTLN